MSDDNQKDLGMNSREMRLRKRNLLLFSIRRIPQIIKIAHWARSSAPLHLRAHGSRRRQRSRHGRPARMVVRCHLEPHA